MALFNSVAIAKPMTRKILLLWDSSETENLEYTFSSFHQHLEVILNYYGLIPEYLDINQDIPKIYFKEEKINNYLGLMTWTGDIRSHNPLQLIELFEKFSKANKKVAFLGDLPFLENTKGEIIPLKIINKLFSKWQIQISGEEWKSPLGLKVIRHRPSEEVEFERSVDREIPSILTLTYQGPEKNIWEEVDNQIKKKKSPTIIVSDKIFYVTKGLDLFWSKIQHISQWRINPFKLIEWFTSGSDWVSPDLTTLNGKRIFYSHIDGDGFINISDFDRLSLNGKIIREKFLEKYKLPTTVSVIAAELDPHYFDVGKGVEEAKKIFALDFVEPATHSYFHPLSWDEIPIPYDRQQYSNQSEKYKEGAILSYKSENSPPLLDYQKEILGSINFIEKNLLDSNKKVKILLWSGNCRPPKKVFELLEKNKIANLNGGGQQMDKRNPSYSHLWPLYREIEGHIQVYASNFNENPYTNLWNGPYNGYSEVLETFQNTESPIRVGPINIYYHFYSGEKISSIKALKEVYDWVQAQEINPITTTEYIKMVLDYKKFSVEKISSWHYQINHGAIKTIRLNQSNLFPDYLKSKNIIGHQLFQNQMYLFLGPKDQAELYLEKKEEQKITHLVSSNSQIQAWDLNSNKLNYQAHSFTPHELTLKLPSGAILRPENEIERSEILSGNIVKIYFKKKDTHLTLTWEKS